MSCPLGGARAESCANSREPSVAGLGVRQLAGRLAIAVKAKPQSGSKLPHSKCAHLLLFSWASGSRLSCRPLRGSKKPIRYWVRRRRSSPTSLDTRPLTSRVPGRRLLAVVEKNEEVDGLSYALGSTCAAWARNALSRIGTQRMRFPEYRVPPAAIFSEYAA